MFDRATMRKTQNNRVIDDMTMDAMSGDFLLQQEPAEAEERCAVLTPQQAQQIPGLVQPQSARFCKAEEGEECIEGTFCLPGGSAKEKTRFSFLLTQQKLLFAEAESFLPRVLQKVPRRSNLTPGAIFCTLLQLLIADDLERIESLEDRNAKLEAAVLSGTLDNFDHKMMALRKEILALSHYYMQFGELCSLLQENNLHFFSKRELEQLRRTGQRIARLWDETKMLNDYSMQICEVYQAQISIRQNKIMKILTIVTTVFLPLSLIVGWYGMNFRNMPELEWQYGYPAVILICAAVVAVCVRWFKKKRFW